MKKEPSRKKRITLLILRYAVLAVLIISLIVFIKVSLANRVVVTYTRPTPTVKVTKAKKGSISQRITLPTYIEAKDMIPVIPFVQGKVIEYNIKVGDFVNKDDVIAKIDNKIYLQQQIQAQAAFDAYSKTLDRVKQLYDKKATSKQQLDEIQAKADASKAQLELATIQLSYATVKAPITGTVLLAPSAKASVASAPNPLAVIADLEKLVVNIKVSEEYYNKLKDNFDNLKVLVYRPESKVKDEAKVISISPFMQAETKMFTLRCELKTDVNNYKPGMYVIADVIYKNKDNAYYLPQSVKKTDGNLYYYVSKDQSVKFIDANVFDLLIENNDYFEISDDYKDLLFVCDGQNQIVDGQKVILKESK